MLTAIPNLFRRIFGNRASPEIQRGPTIAPTAITPRGFGLDVYLGDSDESADFAITRYPPFDEGIPTLPYEKIVRSQQELIDRIFRTAGVSRADFERLYLPPIVNLARHVHLLPATAKHYFRGTGGLFRMSMDIALNSLQSANASVFPTGGGVERRFAMQPRWTLATFLAGLCSQNYRTVNMMAVMTRENKQWTPLLDHLFDWCKRCNADRYFVRWVDDLHLTGAQASAAYSISQVVPAEVLQYLADDNNQVVPAMTAAIAGVETNISENPIGRLVAPVITRVIEEDEKRSANNYGHLVIGAHLETHLLDAMRRLIKNGKWIPNNVASGGRLWVGKEGVFLDWPNASADISNMLTRDSFAGVPKDPDTLSDLLVSAKLLQNNARGGRYWTITFPATLELKEGFVKLHEGRVIFPQGYDFTPYEAIALTLDQGKQKSSTHPAAPPRQEKTAESNNPATRNPDPPKQPLPRNEDRPKNIPASPSAQPLPEIGPGEGGGETYEQLPPETPTTEPVSAAKKKGKPGEKGDTKTRREGQPPRLEEGKPDSKGEESPISGAQAATIDPEVSDMARKLLMSLKPPNSWLLNELLRTYRNQGLTGKAVALSYGYAIAHDELNSYGTPIMDFMEELGMKGWLWQDKTRASRKIHPVEIDGKTYRMIVLKPDIAASLGFDTTYKE